MAAKAKGSSGERELAAILSKLLGCEIKRNLALASRGEQTEDIRFSLGGRTYLVECKRRESLSRNSWFRQAEEHVARNGGGIPLVMYRRESRRVAGVLQGSQGDAGLFIEVLVRDPKVVRFDACVGARQKGNSRQRAPSLVES